MVYGNQRTTTQYQQQSHQRRQVLYDTEEVFDVRISAQLDCTIATSISLV
jgi:hypothetical protein